MSGLHTHNLSIGYPPDTILMDSLNLELNPGDFIGLVGQNGVGKSTLIRTLVGLQNPLNGEITVDSKRLNLTSQNEIAKKIGVVLTGKPDALNLSVLELIALGRHPHSGWLGILKNKDKEKIEEAITQMEINYIATKKLYELSDGQLQKVMIARALAQDTDLIVLDEPTSHLDLKNKIEVLEHLRKISRTGKGILISTHEIQLASKVCDQFWCVDFNVPMRTGTSKELLSNGTLHEYLHLPVGFNIL